ncbi:hypothetical protein [Amycolatopsis sp. cmx-11-51]|uniref:hypothetical protein n=1 Tax=unclassified Amycolatopsis TaxID=2618356 RepID=UPI0039E509EF
MFAAKSSIVFEKRSARSFLAAQSHERKAVFALRKERSDAAGAEEAQAQESA